MTEFSKSLFVLSLCTLVLLACSSDDSGPADLLWQVNVGGSLQDHVNDAVISENGTQIIFTGFTKSQDQHVVENKGGANLLIAAVDLLGEIMWTRTIGGSGDDIAHSITPTSDGGFIIVGSSASSDGDLLTNLGGEDIWVLKFNSIDQMEWQLSFGGSGDDIAYDVMEIAEGAYIVVGSSTSQDEIFTNNHADMMGWGARLDRQGELVWIQSYGIGSMSAGKEITMIDHDRIFIGLNVSSTSGFGYGGTDVFIQEINPANGAVIFGEVYGTAHDDEVGDVIPYGPNFMAFTMTSSSNHHPLTSTESYADINLYEVTGSLHIAGQVSIAGNQIDVSSSMIVNDAGGLVLAGFSNSTDLIAEIEYDDHNGLLLQFNQQLELTSTKMFGGHQDDEFVKLIQLNAREYVLIGNSNSFNGQVTDNLGGQDIWIVGWSSLSDLE